MFRKIIKKLNNFRFASICMAICSGATALYALGGLFLYHFAGEKQANYKRLPGFTSDKFIDVNKYGVIDGKSTGLYLGIILFFCILFALICGILVAYSCIPFIKNKDKLLPRKDLLIVGFVSAVFELAVIVLLVIMAAVEHPHTELGVWLTLPIGIITLVGNICYLIAYLKCDFYMPEVKKE